MEAFGLLCKALEEAGIRYAVGGSWASTAFGDPWFTNDVEVLADFTKGKVSINGECCADAEDG